MIGSVNSGTKVTIKERLGDWYKVSVKIGGAARDGYMFAEYVTRTGGSSDNSGSDNSGSGNNGSSAGGDPGRCEYGCAECAFGSGNFLYKN